MMNRMGRKYPDHPVILSKITSWETPDAAVEVVQQSKAF